jgi:hypothetical protein
MSKHPQEPVDTLCLEQAVKGALTDLRCSCEQWAEHYDVPTDIVFAVVADRFIFLRAGIPPLPIEEFVISALPAPNGQGA